MSVRVSIVDGALGAGAKTDFPGAGAVVVFEGVVRPTEGSASIEALEYQTYEPMAQRMLERIGEELSQRHGLIGLDVEHSRGRVGVGECSFRLVVASAHRKEAMAAMNEFIDLLKRDVPIWKRPIRAAGARQRS